MRAETIASIKMLIKADPDTTPELLEQIERICTGRRSSKRDLIDGNTARLLIGGGQRPISRVTLSKWVKNGVITPVRISRRIVRYDRNEIEKLAYEGRG